MGIRYSVYRISHEIKKRSGLLKKKHPINPPVKHFISLENWKNSNIEFLIQDRELLTFEKIPHEGLKEKASKILKGEICFFSSEWKDLGTSFDWITNPDTNYRYDIQKHWSEINDFNPSNGDIKYVWEKSRFSYLITIMRNDFHFDEDHADFVFSEIENWIDMNPINQGPNWKCSQEISLRIFNWMYLLNFYKNSKALDETLWNKIQHVIYWSLHHVYHHINFSRIAVRNNHAITETLALTLSELIFPFFPASKKWSAKGRKWLEKEVDYQVYDDGTFLQFSFNYHRVLIQLFSFGIALTERNNKPMSEKFYQKAYKSVNFLYQCLQKENGFLPNYGANDGALFFPFSDNQYRDFRPQLNSLHLLLTNEKLFDDLQINEDYNWIQRSSIPTYRFEKITHKAGILSFENSGFYTCRTPNSFTLIRCGNHKDRPSHADNLHLDIWVNGENVIRDSGTYKYNTSKEFSEYFTGTRSHNSVIVNNESQMLKGNRFIWYFWSQAKFAEWSENKEYYIFRGKTSVFRHLNPKGLHYREVKINKEINEWKVNDEIFNLEGFSKKQIWHFDENKIEILNSKGNKPSKEISYVSSFYGQKSESNAIGFSFERSTETIIRTK